MGYEIRSPYERVPLRPETYPATVTCTNCGDHRTIDVPKGERVGEGSCRHCGCRALVAQHRSRLGPAGLTGFARP